MTLRNQLAQSLEITMRLSIKMAFLLLFVPLIASAQFKDLDAAMTNLNTSATNVAPWNTPGCATQQ